MKRRVAPFRQFGVVLDAYPAYRGRNNVIESLVDVLRPYQLVRVEADRRRRLLPGVRLTVFRPHEREAMPSAVPGML